ncbi:single-strand binding protein [Scandinavium goeteborgense]|uniref:Single-stranded DNA-binding protein n=2 Tax=Scandinavium goeteborgense TaxID=1851514 RepID=A0A4R6DSH9_SCAGO|nr:single-strand binding protein [Scandinavium goeteborgense]
MSRGMNEVRIVGNVGNDPEIKTLDGGQKLVNFSVATSDSWLDKETNERKEVTEWHRITLFGKSAEIAEKYVKKGTLVLIEGQLKTRKYNDNGTERYALGISVPPQGFQILSGGRKAEQSEPPQQS